MKYHVWVFDDTGRYLFEKELDNIKGAINVAIIESSGRRTTLLIEDNGKEGEAVIRGVCVSGLQTALTRKLALEGVNVRY